jgi:hypothetical protein
MDISENQDKRFSGATFTTEQRYGFRVQKSAQMQMASIPRINLNKYNSMSSF